MGWLIAPVDIYCERLGPAFWAEPINAISNASFFIAAWLLLGSLSPTQQTYRQDRLIVCLIALVGICSLLFHTAGDRLGLILDISGIMLFVHAYLYLCLRRMLGWSRKHSALLLVLFFCCLMSMEAVPAAYNFNGSVAYFPCVAVIGWMWKKTRNPTFLHAGLLLMLSLAFRTLDMAACPFLPIGTHFLWHLCNGAVLYLLGRTLIRHASPAN